MKKLTFVIFFITAAYVSNSQVPNNQPQQQASQGETKTLEQRAQELTAGMVKHLRLSATQAKKVQAINLLGMQQAEDARQKHKADPRQFALQMDVISESRLSRIKDVLTTQQFAQYQQRREEKMGIPKEAQSNPSGQRQESSYQTQY